MALEIEKTALWADIRKVFKDVTKPVRFRFEATIHTEKEDISVMKMPNMDIVRDYMQNIGEEIHLAVMVPLGDYVYRVFPYRANLEVSVKRKLILEAGNVVDQDTEPVTTRYKAVILPNVNKSPKAGELDQIDKHTLDRMEILTVKLQLLDRSLEPLRIKTTGGTFMDVTHKDMIHALMAAESSKVLVDGKSAIDGMDLVEPDNREKKKHIIVPTGTPLINLPSFLHEKFNGVYSKGVGTFLQTYNQKKLWFVFPLSDAKRFDKDNKAKAIFYMVPQDRFSNVERTYREAGDVTHIVITGAKHYQDAAEADMMNSGNGFKMAEARSFMKKPVKMRPDGPVGSRPNLNHEVIVHDRKDGLNYAPVSPEPTSSNPFTRYSALSLKTMARVDLVWENANPDLIYPGMPCKYVFLENDEIRELKGSVVFCHVSIQSSTIGVTMNGFGVKCMLTLLVERINITPEQEKKLVSTKSGAEAVSKANPSSNQVPEDNTFADAF